MKKIHAREKEQFKQLLSQGGVDRIEKRFQILEIFLNTETHVTVDEMVHLLKKNKISFTRDFVNDTLKLMVHYGFAESKLFESRIVRYEHRHMGIHHDHMICIKCKGIIEFKDDDIERKQIEVANKHGFHMLLHKMEIYGICSACRMKESSLIPLADAKPGQRLVIKSYEGGKEASMRLIHMGLRIGDNIEVITNTGKGQLIISVEFNRYLLGRGMAQKIIVEQV